METTLDVVEGMPVCRRLLSPYFSRRRADGGGARELLISFREKIST